jgi:hypothetical protein
MHLFSKRSHFKPQDSGIFCNIQITKNAADVKNGRDLSGVEVLQLFDTFPPTSTLGGPWQGIDSSSRQKTILILSPKLYLKPTLGRHARMQKTTNHFSYLSPTAIASFIVMCISRSWRRDCGR